MDEDTGENTAKHSTEVNKRARASRFVQKPVVIWFTGLSGSGKSTIANALERKLFNLGYATYLLDGDNVRQGLCADLGFEKQDRIENVRRVGELSKLMVDAGLIVLVSLISPFEQGRQLVRGMVEPDEFFECFVDTPIEVCELRDPKGLYKRAREGKVKMFTGIDSPYERPMHAEIAINTEGALISELVQELLNSLQEARVIMYTTTNSESR